jgi:hypothetical protein
MRTEPALPARFRRKQFWIAKLLLPAILFRALIPGGFMLAVDSDGTLGLQFCPGTFPAAADTRPAHASHHDGASGDSGTAGHGQLLCPFAATAGPAPLPTLTALVIAPDYNQPVISRPVSRDTIPTIIRAQSPRAPPRLG